MNLKIVIQSVDLLIWTSIEKDLNLQYYFLQLRLTIYLNVYLNSLI